MIETIMCPDPENDNPAWAYWQCMLAAIGAAVIVLIVVLAIRFGLQAIYEHLVLYWK